MLHGHLGWLSHGDGLHVVIFVEEAMINAPTSHASASLHRALMHA